MNGDQLLDLLREENKELYDLCCKFVEKEFDLGFAKIELRQPPEYIDQRLFVRFSKQTGKHLYDFVCAELEKQRNAFKDGE